MTIEERKMANEGRDLWNEYISINGYSFKPNKEGLKKLSRLLDLEINYIQKRINLFLEC